MWISFLLATLIVATYFDAGPCQVIAPQQSAPIDTPQSFERPQVGISLLETSEFIRVNEARRVFGVNGSGLAVAVIDTGLRVTHTDFKGRVPDQQNFTTDNDGDAKNAADGNGHGTNVGGIIVADHKHKGVAPGARVIPLKF